MTSTPTTWLRCHRPLPHAAHRLICFPHAGGTASAYRSWPSRMGSDIEVHAVQYPGHEDRLGEPMIDRMDTLVEQVVAEIVPFVSGRFALFGHSMGGAVAYEVALRLRALGVPEPDHLFISGRQPPQYNRPGTLHTKDDQAVVDELIRLKPANAELMAEPELAAIVLPVVRNDYRLIETYQPTDSPPLRCPITALVGVDDTELTVAQAADWSACTQGPMRLHTFDGDHFYLQEQEQRSMVIDIVAEALRRPGAPGATPVPIEGGTSR